MTTTRQKKHWIFFIVVVVGAISISLWQSNAENSQEGQPESAEEARILKDLTPEESHALIQQHEGDENFVILDVRTPGEFQQARLENAINIDFYSKTFREQMDKLDKEKTYLVYCRSGNRSGVTLQLMEKLNFTHAYNMIG